MIIKYFDHLEDKIRHHLSNRPLFYAFLSGLGVVLFFRGVWMIFDGFPIFYEKDWSGWLTLLLSILIMLSIGTFVQYFLGQEPFISGRFRRKKFYEKTEEELLIDELALIKKDLTEIKELLKIDEK
ncbi:MAG TPA: hypothetical protein ENN31_02060 [Candidatus Vogelbacteria bacterium]|nr:hypothetical protein [Candidatus Vogelbacteria bacterium]